MRKLILPLVSLTLIIITFTNCSSEKLEEKGDEKSIVVEKLYHDTKFITKFKNEYYAKKYLKNKTVSYDDTYNVYFSEINRPIKMLQIYDDLGLDNTFKVTNALIEIPFEKKEEKINLGFIFRTIQNEKYDITEIVSPINGKIISYYLNKLTEKEYLEFRKTYYNYNIKRSCPIGIESSDIICFTTFNACIQNISNGNGSALDAAICDFLPCNALAYVACTLANMYGWIENSDNFVGCRGCGTIVGEL